jgi:hypothetical protein
LPASPLMAPQSLGAPAYTLIACDFESKTRFQQGRPPKCSPRCQVACALRFFYGITLGQKEAFERFVFGKEPAKLPPVFNAEELVCFLEAVTGLRNRVALTTAYAAGLQPVR